MIESQPLPRSLTPEAVADLLRVSRRTVYNCRRSGQPPAIRIGKAGAGWICSSGPSYSSIPQAADPIIWPPPPAPSPCRRDVDALRNQGGALLLRDLSVWTTSPWESAGSLAAEHLDPQPDCQVMSLWGRKVWAQLRTITILKDYEIERYCAS